jgi:HPt (histidine-containing phosphotransfer) domain-containing protein
MNNLELYTRMLGMFRQQAQAFEAQFGAQAEQGDGVAMIRLAHTLKGTAANIGASGVQAAAEKLQQACERDASASSYRGPLQQVVDELALVVRSLQDVEL